MYSFIRPCFRQALALEKVCIVQDRLTTIYSNLSTNIKVQNPTKFKLARGSILLIPYNKLYFKWKHSMHKLTSNLIKYFIHELLKVGRCKVF